MSVAEQTADLQALVDAARGGYAGPDLAAALTGFSLRDESPLEFCRRLEMLLATQADGHLSARLLDQTCAAIPRAPGTGTWSKQVIDGVTVLTLPAFPPRTDPGWAGFLAAVTEARAQDFVLDLRGNAGGDDAYGYALAQILYGVGAQEPVPTPVATRTCLQTPAAFGLQANAIAYQEIRLRARGLPVPPQMESARLKLLKRRDLALIGFYPRERTESMPAATPRAPFTGKLYVLIDDRCASSCENTLQFLEALPGRVLVGERTAGAVTYGEIGKIVLPNSKIAVSLATTRATYRDGRAPERSGYAPDVPGGADALATALLKMRSPPAPSDTTRPPAVAP